MVIGSIKQLAGQLATLLVLQAGTGLATPAVLVEQSPPRMAAEWLPTDNQTLYRLAEGETRSLELNTSSIKQATVFVTVSPCTRDFHWALYYGKAGHLSLQREDGSGEMVSFSIFTSQYDKYLLQLSSVRGGAGVVSVFGEPSSQVRLRLKVRSRRRLATNWDPSPIDPQETKYCVVASHLRNYTSLCAAQTDLKLNRIQKNNRFSQTNSPMTIDTSYVNKESNYRSNVEVYGSIDQRIDGLRLDLARNDRLDLSGSLEMNNQIDVEDFNLYDGTFRNVFRRKKIGRSTKVSDEDPVVACVGERTHHLMENLDPSRTYYVSVFAIAKDRRSGSLLATGSVKARTSTAKRLRENTPHRADLRGRAVYYFKTPSGSVNGAWFTLTTCGGAVDVEVLVRGKRLYFTKNIDPHIKFYVPAPKSTSSIQETSDEGSIQFDSSSEESRMRFVVKVTPNRWDRSSTISVELVASTTRWGINNPELMGDGATVRELRQRRTCRSTQVAFLPAAHNATDVIRYCVIARETTGEQYVCASKKPAAKTQCISHIQTKDQTKVIVQKIFGLSAGKKYAIQVIASNKGSSVPYNTLYVDTNVSCKY